MSVNMSPPLSYANALTALKTLTTQTANFTFTDDELNTALTFAWQDSQVVNTVWDSSLTYTVGTWQYAIPSSMTTVKEIYIIPPANAQVGNLLNSTNYPVKVSQDLWEVVGSNIQFDGHFKNYVGDNLTLYIKGNYKLATTDTLGTDALINYVLWLAADTLMAQLLLKAAFVFLRNDTQIQAIIAAQKLTQERVLMYKQKLFREFQST